MQPIFGSSCRQAVLNPATHVQTGEGAEQESLQGWHGALPAWELCEALALSSQSFTSSLGSGTADMCRYRWWLASTQLLTNDVGQTPLPCALWVYFTEGTSEGSTDHTLP